MNVPRTDWSFHRQARPGRMQWLASGGAALICQYVLPDLLPPAPPARARLVADVDACWPLCAGCCSCGRRWRRFSCVGGPGRRWPASSSVLRVVPLRQWLVDRWTRWIYSVVLACIADTGPCWMTVKLFGILWSRVQLFLLNARVSLSLFATFTCPLLCK